MAYTASRTWLAKLKAAAWAVPVAICFNDVIAGPVHIAGSSMQPTLNPDDGQRAATNDIVLVQKWIIRLHRYCRGDVVVLRSPAAPHELIVKRIIGLEGDWLSVPGKMEIERIPRGCCWVEGDNLPMSEDSHNRFGSIPVALVQGRVSHVLWPFSRLGQVATAVPAGRVLAKNEAAFHDTEY